MLSERAAECIDKSRLVISLPKVVANDLLYYVQNNMHRAIKNLENKMVFHRVDMVSYVTIIAENILLSALLI
jgi:hypothetical protein